MENKNILLALTPI